MTVRIGALAAVAFAALALTSAQAQTSDPSDATGAKTGDAMGDQSAPSQQNPNQAYVHPPEPRLLPAVPPQPADPQIKLDRSNDIDKNKTGFQWCRLYNADEKIAYYTKVFSGIDPNQDKFQAFLDRTYSSPVGDIDCISDLYSADYVLAESEKQNEFNLILQNVKVVMTNWGP
jgi:hypothetical protein